MPDYVQGIEQATRASMEGAREAMQGAAYGAQNLAAAGHVGAQRMVADIGRLMPEAPGPQVHPYLASRHGMYAHEMSLGGDIAAMFGHGVPETTTAYEHKELAARDFGRRVGTATVSAGVYGGAAAASWFGGGAALTKGVSAGWKAGQTMGMARAGGAAFTGIRAAATAGRMGVAAAGLGAGVAGAALGALPGMAAFVAVDAAVGKVMDDVQDRQDIMNFMEASSFRMIQGTGEDVDQKFGAGFNRKARAKIAKGIKKVDLEDPRYDMGDLKGILEKGTELGMFEGTRDAEDFSKKFKDLTTNLKSVTRVLHQSLNEGMETLKNLKEMGHRGPQQQTGAVMQADILGTATGRTAAEMLSIGRQGSEMVRGTGINMATGASMMQQTTAMITSMKQSGALTGEQIAQAGGVGQLSQTVMRGHLQNLNTPFGRGAMMSMLAPGGGLDMSRLEEMAGGETSVEQMYSRASQNISTPGGYVDAVINRGKNMRAVTDAYGEMGGAVVSMGMELSRAKSLTKHTGKSVRDTAKFLALQRGESEEEFEARFKMVETSKEWGEKKRAAFKIGVKKVQQESLRDLSSAHNVLNDKIDDIIAPVSEAVGDAVDDVSDYASDKWRKTKDWWGGKVREQLGVKTTKTFDIKDEDVMDMFIEGGNAISEKEIAETQKITRGIYTDKEVKDFRKTKDYEKLSKETEDISAGEMFKAGAQGLDKLAGTLFKDKEGKSRKFEDLTKKERMFLETRAKDLGMTKSAEQINLKKREAQKQLGEAQLEKMAVNDEKVKALEEEEEKIQGRVATEIFKDDDSWFFGAGTDTEDMATEMFDKGSPKAKKDLSNLIIGTQKAKELQNELAKTEKEDPSNKEKIARLKGELGKATKDKNKAEAGVTKGMAGLGHSQENITKFLYQMDSSAREDPNFKKIATELEENQTELRAEEKKDKYAQVREGFKKRLATMTMKASANLTENEDEKLEQMTAQIAAGEELEKKDWKEFQRLSGKSEVKGLGEVALRGRQIEEASAGGRLDDKEELKTFLKEHKMIPGKDTEKTGKLLDSLMDGPNKVNKAKLLQFETMSAGAKSEVGGVGVFGGEAGGRVGKVLAQEASTINSMVETQTKTEEALRKMAQLIDIMDKKIKG